MPNLLTLYQTATQKIALKTVNATGEAQRIHIIRVDQKTPQQFKKYLSSRANKEDLVNFLCEQWQKYDAAMIKGMLVHIAHGQKYHSIVAEDGTVVSC